MASTTPHTIVLSDQPIIQEEKIANGVALTPGQLVEMVAGDATKIRLHSTAGGNAQAMFVLESPFTNVADGPAIDQAYGTVDTVRILMGRPGDQVYGWVTVGASIAAGAFLESAGSLGALRAATAGTTNHNRVIVKAIETVDNSAGSAKARIKVEIV